MRRTVKLVLLSGLLSVGLVAACVGDDPGSDAPNDGGTTSETGTGTDAAPDTATGGDASDGGNGDSGDGIVEVQASWNHACAITKSGVLYCWGGNDFGQLGKAPSASDPTCEEKNGTKHSCNPKPTAIAKMTDVAHVSSGGTDFTCVIKKDGTVWCWGRNHWGQVGTTDIECAVPAADGGVGTPTRCNPTPAQITIPGVPQTTKAKELGISPATSCALLESGDVYCWGFNDNARAGIALENPTATPSDTRKHLPTKVVFPFEAGPIAHLHASAGTNTTCATAANGKLWCWGKGSAGQQGRLPSSIGPAQCEFCTPTPGAARDTDGGVMTDVTMGATTGATCVRRSDSSVWCFGVNSSGELGNGTTDSIVGDTAHYVPAKVTTIPATTEIVARFQEYFATDTVGDVWVWGENRFGTLGDGTTSGAACNNTNLACVLSPKKNTLLSGMEHISPGQYSVVAQKKDGSVWAWGANTQGQLGHTPKTGGDQPLCFNDRPCNPTPSQVIIAP